MIYKVGMLCKHFKGKTLEEKNIYRILKMKVDGSDIDDEKIIYTGNNNLHIAKNLVIYENIFQNDKIFAREYEDISSILDEEKQIEFNQKIKVQPLNNKEIEYINNPSFIEKKKILTLNKYNKH